VTAIAAMGRIGVATRIEEHPKKTAQRERHEQRSNHDNADRGAHQGLESEAPFTSPLVSTLHRQVA